MSEFNKRFPGILLAYLNGSHYVLDDVDCNELSKYVAGIEEELENARDVIERMLPFVEYAEATALDGPLDDVLRVITKARELLR